ncbi:MAG TPA: major capsid protein [Tepidisphaeraceae bacterium]|jgi:hypothetical protein|nr:major capsid protein [Tepidisphaeraceae bacterium]
MPTYLYPEARELQELGPELMAQEIANDPLFSIFPIETVNAALLQWSVEDDDLGLQQLRGLDGAPQHVKPVGNKSYVAEPGYYGEFETVTEKELTERGGSVIGEAVVSIEDSVLTRQRQLVAREVNRIRQICWLLLTTGTFSVSGKGGTLVYTDTFAIQSYTGSNWGVPATATPLADLRAMQQMGSQFGVDFNASSMFFINRVDANNMLKNSNAADLGGRRTLGGGTVNSIAEANRIIMGEDLPEIVVYDRGYKNDANTYTKFITNGNGTLVGRRQEGDRVGAYRMTRNLNNPAGTPGSYEYVKDYVRGINAPKETPPKIEVHRGHNGGPVLTRPKAIVKVAIGA